MLNGYGRAGVSLAGGISHIHLHALRIEGCDCGIACFGSEMEKISECEFKNLEMIDNKIGMKLEHVCSTIIKDCVVKRATQIGFDISACRSTSLYSCHAHKIVGALSAIGFRSANGVNNMFHRCVVEHVASTDQSDDARAQGFVLTGQEQGTKIIDSCVKDIFGASRACGIQCVSDESSFVALAHKGAHDAPARVVCASWTPDGNYLACGCVRNDSCSVALYAHMIDGLSLVGQCPPSAGDVLAVAWTPDGQFLACGDTAGFVRIFGGDEDLNAKTYVDITSPVSCLAWSPDGKYLACGDADKNIRLYTFDGHVLTQRALNDVCMSSVLSLSWSPDGNYLVSSDFAGHVRLFMCEANALKYISENSMDAQPVWAVSWAPWGNRIVFGDQAGRVHCAVVDNESIKILSNFVQCAGAIQSVAWSPDASLCACADLSGELHVVRCDEKGCASHSHETLNSPLQALAWSYDGHTIIGATDDSHLYLYDSLTTVRDCLVENCKISDVRSLRMGSAFGIAGSCACLRNLCCHNDVSYNRNIGNVVYGKHNVLRGCVQAFDNVSMPALV